MPHTTDEILATLNAQTGKLGWEELMRHFARGVVITVAVQLDLVGVAAAMVRDDKSEVEALLSAGQIRHASDADARRWQDEQPVFWAVVVAPWVLVQECREQ